jgi:hypothetical protein
MIQLFMIAIESALLKAAVESGCSAQWIGASQQPFCRSEIMQSFAQP